MRNIPVSIPDLSEIEVQKVTDAVRSSWISSTGPYVDRFEAEFSRLCDTRSAISVANGTVALHLALATLDLGRGDEVIVPSLTYVATANCVRYTGAQPVFVDVDAGSWCIDPKLVEARITPRTRGIIAVHLYGHPADMDGLAAIARKHGLWLVEDAAEAHFARYKGRTVGGLSDIAMFSFYGNKIITSGEGGALTLNDARLERRARLLRGQGMDPERRYFFPVIGYNYRLTNVACALLCAQLERRSSIIEKRAHIFKRYAESLRDIPGIGFQPIAEWAEPAKWLYCITVDHEYGRSRDELAERLKAVGIDTRPFFVPIHRLPPYQDHAAVTPSLVNTDFLADRGLNLPTFPGLQDEDVERICLAIRTLRA